MILGFFIVGLVVVGSVLLFSMLLISRRPAPKQEVPGSRFQIPAESAGGTPSTGWPVAILSLLSSTLFAATAAAGIFDPPPNGHVKLAWDYPTNELGTNLTFKVYSSTNMSVPLTNWVVLTNVVGTNLSVAFDIQPGPHFFVLTASNFWGESTTSNVAFTPPVAEPAGESLNIHKTP